MTPGSSFPTVCTRPLPTCPAISRGRRRSPSGRNAWSPPMTSPQWRRSTACWSHTRAWSPSTSPPPVDRSPGRSAAWPAGWVVPTRRRAISAGARDAPTSPVALLDRPDAARFCRPTARGEQHAEVRSLSGQALETAQRFGFGALEQHAPTYSWPRSAEAAAGPGSGPTGGPARSPGPPDQPPGPVGRVANVCS